MRRRLYRVLSAALLLFVALPLTAQPRARVSGSIETGAAAIEQPLVSGGAAFYVAPNGMLTARDATIGATAVLATGTAPWQSFLGSGFAQSPAFRNTRLVGSAQALKTTGLQHTLHADLGAEWRTMHGANSGSARLSTGQLSHSGIWWHDVSAGVSAAHTRGNFSALLDAGFTDARRPRALQEQLGGLVIGGFVRDAGATRTQVLDVTPRVIWERSRLRADASVALRAVESGLRGARIGPQFGVTVHTTRGISLFAGAVQRLPDVRSGIPSGRTALIGMRLTGRHTLVFATKLAPAVPALRVERMMLIVDAGPAAAHRVELRGDFTSWQPRACVARSRRDFDCGIAPPAGTWRVSLRINQGAWQQPANLVPVSDDFGSVDGLLLTGGTP